MDHAFLGPATRRRDRGVPALVEAALSPAGRRRRRDGRRSSPRTRSSAGSRGGWSSARGRSGRGRSWPRRSTPRCRRGSTRSRTARTSGRSPPWCWRRRRRTGSSAAGVSPFMLFVYDVRPEKADRIPAVRHVDGTARIQTINRGAEPALLRPDPAFERRTGVPVLVNTSFNTRGEPIVCTPRDAVECFWTSPLDALVIGSFLLEKPEWAAVTIEVSVVVPTFTGPSCSTAASPLSSRRTSTRRLRDRRRRRRGQREHPAPGRGVAEPVPASGRHPLPARA